MASKTISVKEETYRRLVRAKGHDETILTRNVDEFSRTPARISPY